MSVPDRKTPVSWLHLTVVTLVVVVGLGGANEPCRRLARLVVTFSLVAL